MARRKLTVAQQGTFLNALATSANVRGSCGEAGVSTQDVYRLRRADPAFAERWVTALAEGYLHLELQMLDWAMNGKPREVPGAPGEAVRAPSETLALSLLASHRQAVAAARGRAAAAAAGTIADPVAELARRIEAMHRRIAPEAAARPAADDAQAGGAA